MRFGCQKNLLDFLLQAPEKGAIKKHNNGYIQAVAQFLNG